MAAGREPQSEGVCLIDLHVTPPLIGAVPTVDQRASRDPFTDIAEPRIVVGANAV